VDPIAVALGIGATFCWALTLFTMKLAVDRMNWVTLGVLRLWIGIPFVAAYGALTHGFAFGSPGLLWIAFSGGVANAFVGTALYYYALSTGSMHETNVLANTSPFWAVVGAIVVLGEPARWFTLVAGVLVIAGTVFLVRTRPQAQHGRSSLQSLLAALGAGVLWGVTTSVPSKYCLDGGMTPIAYQLLFVAGAGVCWSIVAVPGFIRKRLRMTKRSLWIAFLSSFFGLFVGWVLWLTALQRADGSALAPLNGLTLLFAALLGAVFLRQPLTRRILVGGALTVAGVTLVTALS